MSEHELKRHKKTDTVASIPSPLVARDSAAIISAEVSSPTVSGLQSSAPTEVASETALESKAVVGHNIARMSILGPSAGAAGGGSPPADTPSIDGNPSNPTSLLNQAAAVGAGQPLPAELRTRFERSFDSDLSQVRIHADATSASAANELRARAFTVGSNIFFASGAYEPDSARGRGLIAHETTHALQQGLGSMPPDFGNGSLRLSDPIGGLEREAKHVAAGFLGHSQSASPQTFAVSPGPLAISRSLASDMAASAEAEQKAAVAAPPPRVMEMATVNDAEQAQIQIGRVTEGRSHLFLKKQEHVHEKEEAGTSYKEKEAADHDIVQTDGFIKKNDAVIESLQGIIGLSRGASSAVKSAGAEKDVDATVGADLRLSAFSNLYRTLGVDFARLSGVVNVVLAKYPNAKDKAGNQGGADLAKTIATGGKDTKSTGDVHKGVEDAERKDPVLLDHVSKFQAAMDAFTKGNFAHTIDTAVVNTGVKSNALRNTTADLKFDVVREDSPEVKKSKETITTINADLAAARKGLDKIEAVAKLAATVAGMPAVGALGPGSALAGPMATAGEVKSAAGAGADAVKTLTDFDISEKIKDELAKMMSAYDERMVPALGKLESDQYIQKTFVQQLNKDKVNQSKAELTQAITGLHDVVKNAESQKKDIRDAAKLIADYQAAHGGAKGGIDIAAISEALGEVTIFLEQAKATKEQGDKEQLLTAEMIKRRKSLTGEYDATDPTDPKNTDRLGLGTSKVGVAEKEQMYYDAEKGGEKYYLKMQPLKFELWSDKVKQTPDAAQAEVGSLLKGIDEYVATAEGFKATLQAAMFGGG